MGDAKEILGLHKVAGLGASAEKRKTPKDAFKKPDGVSREVYALTGGLPPIMPTLDPSSLKRRQIPSKKISWQWLPFKTSARLDNLQLCHWVRMVDGHSPAGDYAFDKYNKAVEVVRYTDEEYNEHLVDPGWSREETDNLFDLCEQFDLRFIIIADRFTPPRTVEELKGRYYSAARAIVLARAAVTDEVADHTLVKDTYNTAYEVDRKRALGIILSQSRQQDHEDAKVLEEAKRITEARLDTKIGEEAELPISAPAVAAPAEASRVLRTSSSPLAIAVDVPAPVATPAPAPPVPVVAPVAAAPSGPRGPRVYSRAALLAQQVHAIGSTAGVRTSKRVDQLLEEYGVRSKPKVPTQAVCAEHLELRKEVITLIQLQKQVQAKEVEVAALRENPFADVPATPSTPKVKGGQTILYERPSKRDHKRKATTKLTETPLSPPYQKRARKMKGSES
ncbi:unnamed protein product [Sphagnum jensenii]|uniref:SWR1-complex protein 4 n=1 Tax=Sphagnum jensenii TaxID=128206 RepID=A0ABP0X8S1_9BRYO